MASNEAFRKLALSFPGAVEEPHFEKASFRVNKKIFATLPPDMNTAVIMLPVIEQSVFCSIDKALIYPVPGHWGKLGATIFELKPLKASLLRDALSKAYEKVAPKSQIEKVKAIETNKAAPMFFPTPAHFREWLAKNHDKKEELLVGFYKIGSGKPSITWPQSVDEALCFGWIDGVTRNIDRDSYSIRFTPRKAKSIWSVVNIKKVEELMEKGLMQPAGIAAYQKREDARSKIYSHENGPAVFPSVYEEQFRANTAAWAYFQKMPQSYRNPATHWVISAKQEVTRQKRLNELITDSEAGRKIKYLNY